MPPWLSEKDAHVVAVILREEVCKKDDPALEGRSKLIVAKQRNGPTDPIRMAFIKRYTRFENCQRTKVATAKSIGRSLYWRISRESAGSSASVIVPNTRAPERTNFQAISTIRATIFGGGTCTFVT